MGCETGSCHQPQSLYIWLLNLNERWAQKSRAPRVRLLQERWQAAQGVEGWGPGPPRISECATSKQEGSTKGVKGEAETKAAQPVERLAHLGAQVERGERVTPENKASNSLGAGEHLQPTSPRPRIWFLALAPPPRFSRHTRNGNKYPQSSRNQSFPSSISIPSLGRDIVLRKPTSFPCCPARTGLQTLRTQPMAKAPKSPAGDGERRQPPPSGRGSALRPHPPRDAWASLSVNPCCKRTGPRPAGPPSQDPSKINNTACQPYHLAAQRRPGGAAVSVGGTAPALASLARLFSPRDPSVAAGAGWPGSRAGG